MTLSWETSKKENEFKNGPSSFPVLPRQQINCSGCGSCQSSIKQLSEKQGIPIRIRTNVMINVRRSVWEKNLIDRSLHLKSSLAHHGIASLRYLTYWWVLIPSRSPIFLRTKLLWVRVPSVEYLVWMFFSSPPLYHYFRPLEERDTPYDNRNCWITVPGCPA